jgi:hypothetical protein
MRATCPRSASSGYHAELREGYQKNTNRLNCRTSSSDITGYHADFHEGHGTVREWQGRGMASVNQRGTTWARHGMCELALIVLQSDHVTTFTVRSCLCVCTRQPSMESSEVLQAQSILCTSLPVCCISTTSHSP